MGWNEEEQVEREREWEAGRTILFVCSLPTHRLPAMSSPSSPPGLLADAATARTGMAADEDGAGEGAVARPRRAAASVPGPSGGGGCRVRGAGGGAGAPADQDPLERGSAVDMGALAGAGARGGGGGAEPMGAGAAAAAARAEVARLISAWAAAPRARCIGREGALVRDRACVTPQYRGGWVRTQ